MSILNLENTIENLEILTRELALELKDNNPGHHFDTCTKILESLKTPCAIITRDYKIIYINEELRNLIKERNGREIILDEVCYNTVFGIENLCPNCPVEKSIKDRKVYLTDFTSPTTSLNYFVICIPLVYNGAAGAIEIIIPK